MYSTWKSHILLHYYINALQVQEMRKDNQQRSENLAEDITDLLKTNISLKEDVPVEVNPRRLIFCFIIKVLLKLHFFLLKLELEW